MRLSKLTATPHPGGHRIDLSWEIADPVRCPNVRVVRRTGTYPTAPRPASGQGQIVADLAVPASGGLCRLADTSGLQGETVYYYAFFTYQADPPGYALDRHNCVAATATAPYGFAEAIYELLPGIYHRYDTAMAHEPPDDMEDADRDRGALRRFLDLPGSQLDQLYSLARTLAHLYDLGRVDGRLLPLLAQWIGWQSDYRHGFDTQRREIRRAPYVYRTVGIIPNVEATLKRILGRESRTKELGHNVFLSNRPERLNLWLTERDAETWSKPEKPLSLNYAYEGRPAAVEGGGKLWLFFHTLRNRVRENRPGGGRGQWDLWYKTWEKDKGWSESRPLTNSPAIDKHPAAVWQGGTLWVFWNTWTENRGWRLSYQTYREDAWSPRQALWHEEDVERRSPQAVVDGEGKLWLFWRQRAGTTWQVRYLCHDGGVLEKADVHNLRDAEEEDPRVEEDLFVFLDKVPRLWVLWARRETLAAGGTRWRLAYRVKPDLGADTWNWSEVYELPPDDPEDDDREPAMALDQGGNPELYWSSNRDGSFSIWRVSIEAASLTPGTPEKLTPPPFSQRGPLPVPHAAGTRLFYYSNQSLTYGSQKYSATQTVDARYAGSTTVDTRNIGKIGLRGHYDDFETYTLGTVKKKEQEEKEKERHDLGMRYARDAVAFFLTPSVDEASGIDRELKVVEQVLRQFLPIQVRALLRTETPPHRESVYTYDQPEAKDQWLIGERVLDSTLPEHYLDLTDKYTDVACNWRWIYSFSETMMNKSHRSILVSGQDPLTQQDVVEVDRSCRTWHVGVQPGDES